MMFSSFNRKIHKFWFQNLQLEKFEGADFEYDNSFFKFQPKNTKIRHFCPKFKNFYIYTKLCSKTNSRTLISNMIIIFSNSSQKYPSLVPNLRIFILHQTLQSDKFEGIDFKYDNGFFKL